MSFEQKYLKYKSKYLALKASLNNVSIQQNGGSIYGKNVMDIENLSITPNMLQAYGYEFKNTLNTELVGGFTKNNINSIKKLTELVQSNQLGGENLSDSELSNEFINTTELSSQSGGEDSEDKKSSSSESEKSSSSESDKSRSSESEKSSSSESKKSESEEKSDSEMSKLTDTPQSEQHGGMKKKAKNNKKYFFDDSDLDMDSTTDSELSSLDSDSSSDFNDY